MSSESDDCTEIVSDLLPAKSALVYEKRYEEFMQWKKNKNETSLSEDVLLSYFHEISDKKASSSLWTMYSMLKSTIKLYHNVNISEYSKLLAFLKQKKEGYKRKKAKTFSSEEINKFIQEAPDNLYLFTKVASIIGIMGACRKQELYNLQINDVEVYESTILVKINNSNKLRSFTLTGSYYDICMKFMKLRPTPCSTSAFFLYYDTGKCFNSRIGINKFGNVGKSIANYLNLPNPERYTGNCFRKSSAMLSVNSGDITSLQRHGRCKTTSIADVYVDVSVPQGTEFTENTTVQEQIQERTESMTPQSTAEEITTVKQEIEEDLEPSSPQISHSSETVEVTIVKNESEEPTVPLQRANVIEDKQTNSDQAAITFTEEEYITIGKSIAIQLKVMERKQQTITLRLISDAIQHGKLGNLTEASAITLRPTPGLILKPDGRLKRRYQEPDPLEMSVENFKTST